MTRFIPFISSLFFLLLVSALPGAAKEERHVLIVYAQDKWHPAHELTERGIRTVLESHTDFDVHLHVEYLDLANFSSLAQKAAATDYIQKKYAESQLSSIITVYDTALYFMMNDGNPLLPGVPIVASQLPSQVSEMVNDSPMRRLITGTIVGESMAEFMQSIFQILPGTKHIALISGSSLSDRDGEAVYRRELEKLDNEIELIELTQMTLEAILRRVDTLPPDTVLLYGSMFADAAGKVYVPREIIPRISTASNAPVFGLYDSYLGFGIVGGYLFSFEEHGKEAARLLLRILAGERPDAIEWSDMPSTVATYDWRELKRWGIHRSTLPPGSELRYYVPSFWESYKWEVCIAALVILTQLALIVSLLISIRRRRQYEKSLEESEEQVRLAVDAAGAGLWSMNLATGKVWATDKAKALYGLTPDKETSYDSFLNRVHPEDLAAVDVFMQEAQVVNDGIRNEWRVVLPDGSHRWLAINGKTLATNHKAAPKFLKGACIDITENKNIETSLRQHQKALENLTGRLIHNQEEELRRLSRELHDDLTQRLAALVIDIGLLAGTMPLQSVKSGLINLRDTLSLVTRDIHNLSRRLHPSVLSDLGIIQAAIMECDAFQDRTSVRLTHSFDTLQAPLPFEVELCLYRILQESLQNLYKHSGSGEGFVLLESFRDSIALTIQDFGIGFEMGQQGGGIGLLSMRERVHLINGVFTVDSARGEGTMIHVCIPLKGDYNASSTDPAG